MKPHVHLEAIQAIQEDLIEKKRAFLLADGWTEGDNDLWQKGDYSLYTDDEAFMTYSECPCWRKDKS